MDLMGLVLQAKVTKEQWKKGFLASQVVAEMDSEKALASQPEAVTSALSKRPGMVQTPGRTLSWLLQTSVVVISMHDNDSLVLSLEDSF